MMMIISLFRIGMVLSLIIFGLAVPAHAVLSEAEIPEALAPWKDWVLYGSETSMCPVNYNDGAVTRCQWPSTLELEVSVDGGRFQQNWVIYARGWVPLPGGENQWPDAVVVNGRSAAVMDRGGRPMILLGTGEYRVSGRFFWHRPPEVIHVPPLSGLVKLIIDGREIKSPRYDSFGRLWLQSKQDASQGSTGHRVQVFRLFSDTIPMQVTTVLKLDISGPGRELVLENVLMADGIAMDLGSRLPARIDEKGQLIVQARAGQWQVRVLSRLAGPVDKLSAGPDPYADEIWSFQPQHHLRMVELEGMPSLEPTQTEMPAAWHRWPAYQVQPGAVLAIKEMRRGDPDPAPNKLRLHRQWWLDFDGRGFTLHDRLSGTLNRQWALTMKTPVRLGRVAVDGQDRIINQQGDTGDTGIEVRRGRLDLQADSRLPLPKAPIPALGWDHDVEHVSGVLHLPPGWRLLGTRGIDSTSHSWIQQWSLLDFFLVLIISLAFGKLRSWRWGLAALGTMVLIFHEPGAPRLVWLQLLAVMALLSVLPLGWLRRLVTLWGLAAGIVLLVAVVPFMVNQLRWAFYPQLAPVPSATFYKEAGQSDEVALPMPAKSPSPKPVEKRLAMQSPPQVPLQSGLPDKDSTAMWQTEPNALIPTGPGLPDWTWQSVSLNWNGPVSKNQYLRFYMMGPRLNFFICLLRVGLLAMLIWGMFDWPRWWQKLKPRLQPAAIMLCVALLFALPDAGVQAEEMPLQSGSVFPPSDLLETFKQRLLEKPDCLPNCADISRMEVTISGDQLQVILKVHTAQLTAVPLPVNSQSWAPDQILLDNAPISGLSRDEQGQLWGLVSSGSHTIVIIGDIGHLGVFQIPLPLKPHMATFSTPGWDLKGIQPEGGVGASLQLVRLQSSSHGAGDQSGGSELPAFLRVKRQLKIGLTWRVASTITRLTPLGAPVVVSIPLLATESVITEGLTVTQSDVLVTLGADQRQLTYHSTLEISPRIQLTAPSSVPWTETWILDVGPVWHCNFEGIPPIHHQGGAGSWQPQWQPWPGEQVTIHVQRPRAMDGQLVTIDKADLAYVPGRRFASGELNLRLRTSRGEPYTLELPPKSNLQDVVLDGRSLPIRQDGPYITIPLRPGGQNLKVQWHQPTALSNWVKTPAINLNHTAVNARVSVQLPTNRWILMVGGPRWGPAVLFWSYFGVVLLAAIALGRLPLTPLGKWGWLLLGLGLTQVPPVMALIVVGWLLALSARGKFSTPNDWLTHNAMQVGLVLWSLVALVCLFLAVKAGLVGQPDMQIQGNQSYAQHLFWTQDRVDSHMPQPWVLSLPVWFYRVLMLAWSLWLAWTLLTWLKWGWQCFSSNGAWHKRTRRHSDGKQGAAPALDS
jgi:hypothetical protein